MQGGEPRWPGALVSECQPFSRNLRGPCHGPHAAGTSSRGSRRRRSLPDVAFDMIQRPHPENAPPLAAWMDPKGRSVALLPTSRGDGPCFGSFTSTGLPFGRPLLRKTAWARFSRRPSQQRGLEDGLALVDGVRRALGVVQSHGGSILMPLKSPFSVLKSCASFFWTPLLEQSAMQRRIQPTPKRLD